MNFAVADLIWMQTPLPAIKISSRICGGGDSPQKSRELNSRICLFECVCV